MIEINSKYGCLTVLDMGEEYQKTEKYLSGIAELKREYAKKKNIPLIEISYKQKKFEKVEQILKDQNIL